MYESPKIVGATERTQPEIEQMCQTLNCHNEILSSILYRLESMRTRIFGPISEKGEDASKAPTPSGTQFALRGSLIAQRDMLDRSTKMLFEIEKFS